MITKFDFYNTFSLNQFLHFAIYLDYRLIILTKYTLPLSEKSTLRDGPTETSPGHRCAVRRIRSRAMWPARPGDPE